MRSIATTRMSSKGQVVIPESVRTMMKLKTGDRFVVIGRGDSVVLKAIAPPPLEDIKDLLSEAQKQARIARKKNSGSAAPAKPARNGK